MASDHDYAGEMPGSLFRMSWAARYVGAPFADGGRGPVSFDCWGLVRAVYADHRGVDLPTYGDISSGDLVRVARAMAGDRADWQPVDAPAPFDVALMSGGHGGRMGVHVGVMVDGVNMLHTERATGAVVVPVSDFRIKGRLLGWHRYSAQ